LFWHGHRAIVRHTGGRRGLWRPKAKRWGTLALTTTGRRSGQPRTVILGYLTDGANLTTLAMNGWAPAEPDWWRNLQADPRASVQTRDGQIPVLARAAHGQERQRLWRQWAGIDGNLDAYAARRPGETAVVVLEPQAS